MTIDEAIEKSKELASTYRIAAKNAENIFISKLMQETKRKIYIKLAEEHEQLAEWLEELKAYRKIGTVEECKNSVLDIQKAYNNAIDDYVNNCSEYYFNVDDSQSSPYLRNINIISQPNIERIAEQLRKKFSGV